MPQFEMPRTTPPDERTMLPVVRAILANEAVSWNDGYDCGTMQDRLFDLVDATAWAYLESVSAAVGADFRRALPLLLAHTACSVDRSL